MITYIFLYSIKNFKLKQVFFLRSSHLFKFVNAYGKFQTKHKQDFTDLTGGFMNSRNNISLCMFNYKIVVLEYRLLYL